MDMSENNATTKSPWSPYHLGLISYFCIILPGAWLFAENYKRLGCPRLVVPYRAISLVWFVLFIAAIAYLPSDYSWAAEVVHLAYPIVMILLQNAAWQRWREQTDDLIPTAALGKPIVLSVMFALFVFGAIAGKDWYLQYKLERQMELAQEHFMQGRFTESVRLLQAMKMDYPRERTIYINLAIAQEAAGMPDSAIKSMNYWLTIAPDDKEAAEILYRLRYGKTNE
jgi:tetratricopeptide (TPR) repeat protein